MSRPFAQYTTLWKIIDWIGDCTAIPEKYSIHILSIQAGFIDSVYPGAFDLLRMWWKDTPSLFMNGVFFLQLRFPFWIGIQIRPFTARYFQCGIGWKGNGRLGLLFRFLHDESSAAGMDGPNKGQTTGMNDGTK